MNPTVTILPPMFAEGYVPLQYGGDEMVGLIPRHETYTVSHSENARSWNKKRRMFCAQQILIP